MSRPKLRGVLALPTALISEICSFGDLLDYMAFGCACTFALSVTRLAASSPHAVCLSRDAFPSADSTFWRYVRPRCFAYTLLHKTSIIKAQLQFVSAFTHSLRSLYIERSGTGLFTSRGPGLDLTFTSTFPCLESLRVPDGLCDLRAVSPSLTEFDVGRCSISTVQLLIDTVGPRLRAFRVDQLLRPSNSGITAAPNKTADVWHALLDRCKSITRLDVEWENAKDIYAIVNAMPHIRSIGQVFRLQTPLQFWCLTLEECHINGAPKYIHQLLRGAPNLRRLEWRAHESDDDMVGALPSNTNVLPDGNNANVLPDGNSMNALSDGNNTNVLPDSTNIRPETACMRHTSLVGLVYSGFRFVTSTIHREWARTLLPLVATDDTAMATTNRVDLPSLTELAFEWCTMIDELQLSPSVRTLRFNACQFNRSPLQQACKYQWIRSPYVTSLEIDTTLRMRPFSLSELSKRFPALMELYLSADDAGPESTGAPDTLITALSTLSHLHTLAFTRDDLPLNLLPSGRCTELIHGLPILQNLHLSVIPRHKYFHGRQSLRTRVWDAAQRHVQNILDRRTRPETSL
jgi:hypothetical protein